MKLLRILSAATVLASGVIVAHAADLTYEPAPAVVEVAPVGNWTGFYLGGSVGYGWGKLDQKDVITEQAGDIKPDGFIAGLQLGGDYQFPSNIVIGALVDLYYSNAKDTFNGYDVDFESPYSTESNIKYFGTGRVRAGYAIDKFLPYVTGGFAWANNKIDDSIYGSDSQTHFGWTVGAGIEYAVTQNWSVKAEYLYTDFGSKTYTFPGDNGSYDVGLKLQTATVGLNYRF